MTNYQFDLTKKQSTQINTLVINRCRSIILPLFESAEKAASATKHIDKFIDYNLLPTGLRERIAGDKITFVSKYESKTIKQLLDGLDLPISDKRKKKLIEYLNKECEKLGILQNLAIINILYSKLEDKALTRAQWSSLNKARKMMEDIDFQNQSQLVVLKINKEILKLLKPIEKTFKSNIKTSHHTIASSLKNRHRNRCQFESEKHRNQHSRYDIIQQIISVSNNTIDIRKKYAVAVSRPFISRARRFILGLSTTTCTLGGFLCAIGSILFLMNPVGAGGVLMGLGLKLATAGLIPLSVAIFSPISNKIRFGYGMECKSFTEIVANSVGLFLTSIWGVFNNLLTSLSIFDVGKGVDQSIAALSTDIEETTSATIKMQLNDWENEKKESKDVFIPHIKIEKLIIEQTEKQMKKVEEETLIESRNSL